MRILFRVLLLLSSAACAYPQQHPALRQLPEVIIRDICATYSGKPAFDARGETTFIDCDWIRALSVIKPTTAIESYRQVLDHSITLADLRFAQWPDDIDCGNFDVQPVAGNLAVVCTSDAGGKIPYVFIADSSGRILRMETVLDFKRVYRDAMARAIERKRISRFYEPYIDLNTDLMLAKLRYTATPLDSVRLENGRISIVMEASKRPR